MIYFCLKCARNGDKDTLQQLLQDTHVRRHVNDLDENGISALHYGAKAGNFEIVRMLVKDGDASKIMCFAKNVGI